MSDNAKNLTEDEINKISSMEENFEDDFQNEDDETNNIEGNFELREDLHTHQKIRTNISGDIVSLEKGKSKTILQTTDEMSVDSLGLIHSGFVFSAAEFAAVVAVNEENLVIIAAKTKFLAPAKSGDLIEFRATAKFEDSRKREIKVIGEINGIKIFEGTFQAVLLENHILKTKIKNIDKNYHAR